MVDKGQEFASSIRQNKKQSETNERTFLLPMLERTDHKLIVNSLHSEASNFVADALSRQQVNAVFQHSVQMDW